MNLDRSLVPLAAALVGALLLFTGPAGAASKLAQTVAASGCFSEDSSKGALITIASGWQGVPIDTLAATVGVDADGLLDDANYPRALAALETGTDRLARDIATYHSDICPLLRLQSVWPTDVAQKQQQFHNPYQPYFKAAQVALAFAACADGAWDGAFGPASRSAWQAESAVADRVPPLSAAAPTPAEVLELIRHLRSCAPEDRGTAVDAGPFVRVSIAADGCGLLDDSALGDALRVLDRDGTSARRLKTGLSMFWAVGCDPSERGDRPPAVDALLSLLRRAADPASPVHGVDVFAGASNDARLHYGSRFVAESTSAADRNLGVALLSTLGSDESWYFLLSAKAAGLIDALPPRPEIVPPARDDASEDSGPDGMIDSVEQERLYQHFLRAERGELAAIDVAREFIHSYRLPEDSDPGFLQNGIPINVDISHEDVVVAIRLGDLVLKFPAVGDLLSAEAPPQLNFAVATALFEGLGDAGQNRAVALPLLRVAAEGGLVEAQYRLAVADENGYGVDRNIDEAIRFYRMAADGGAQAADFDLARLYEEGGLVKPDPQEAAKWYAAAVHAAESQSEGSSYVAQGLQQRLTAGSVYLASAEGHDFLVTRAAAIPGTALALGNLYSCVDCGGVVNLAEAAAWYRRALSAGDHDAASPLARILMQYPDLAAHPGEAGSILADNQDLSARVLAWIATRGGAVTDDRTANAELANILRQSCLDVTDSDRSSDCATVGHDLAIGALSTRFVATGFNFLKELDAAVNADDQNDPEVGAAMIDVLAFYGDFDRASERLAKAGDAGDLAPPNGFFSRNPVIRRLVINQAVAGAAPNPSLVGFLQRLSARDDLDNTSSAFLKLLQSGPDADLASLGLVTGNLPDLRAAFAAQEARGGISRGLVTSARSLASALFGSGNREDALRYELIALQTERALEHAGGARGGPIPAALSEVCSLSRASHRVSRFGFDTTALVLAKRAVNRLQDVRREIAGLPEDLQLCFRDTVSDTYRWLADLFIGLERPAEADFVLSLLKDHEAFEFAGRDVSQVGDSFRPIPLSEAEQAIGGRIDEIAPPLTTQAARRLALLQKSNATSLTAAERAELGQLDAAIAAASERTDQLVRDIAGARGGDPEEIENQLLSMRGRLRHEVGGKAVAIRFVVLPTRMHAILITPSVITTHTWTTIDGKPFSEAALDAKIDAFRTVLQLPGVRPAGRRGRSLSAARGATCRRDRGQRGGPSPALPRSPAALHSVRSAQRRQPLPDRALRDRRSQRPADARRCRQGPRHGHFSARRQPVGRRLSATRIRPARTRRARA